MPEHIQPGDEVFFTFFSRWINKTATLPGRVLAVFPDGTVRVMSASGLVTETVPLDKVKKIKA